MTIEHLPEDGGKAVERPATEAPTAPALPEKVEPKVTKTTEELPCKLNEVEWNSRVHDLTDAYTGLQEKQEKKKAMMTQMNADIKGAEAKHAKLSNVVATRQETREVTVETIFDYEEGTVTRKRTDTGEVLTTREMIDAERQGRLIDADDFISSARDEERKADEAAEVEGDGTEVDDEIDDDELDDELDD